MTMELVDLEGNRRVQGILQVRKDPNILLEKSALSCLILTVADILITTVEANSAFSFHANYGQMMFHEWIA